jgi:tRNA1(Val) A37 N6-methylase TrmN6
LLSSVVREGGYAASRRVLDIGTGTGALALLVEPGQRKDELVVIGAVRAH